ncbi:MAG TPA: hypothetical protein ENK93_03385 [Campylobacteraceae bacterium]|nr:hypothetical protein [Campylobacteraceae bacterium]HHD83900.1 hypothetical protein [Campylobacteraceae bacterium]
MKKLLFVWIAFAVALFANPATAQTQTQKHSYKNERLCKVFKEKITAYQQEMRNDAYAKATLESYKKRAAMFCGK